MLCQKCRSERLTPTPPATRAEAVLRKLTRTRYQVCKACGHRGRYPRQDRRGKRQVDPLFIAAVVAMGCGLIYALRLLG